MKNSLQVSKTTISLIVLIVWAVFSIIFISWTSWNNFKVGKMQAAYNEGAAQAVSQIITGVKKCQGVFPVNIGDKSADLVDLACLQKGGQADAEVDVMEK